MELHLSGNRPKSNITADKKNADRKQISGKRRWGMSKKQAVFKTARFQYNFSNTMFKKYSVLHISPTVLPAMNIKQNIH